MRGRGVIGFCIYWGFNFSIMAKSNYSDLLQSPKWQKKRLDVLNLRGFKCEECGSEDKQLHVHHSRYIKGRKPWEYDNDIFMVLCVDCHDKIHIKSDKKETISENYLTLIRIIESHSITDETLSHIEGIICNYAKKEDPSIIEELFEKIDESTCSGLIDDLIKFIDEKLIIENHDISISMLQIKINDLEILLKNNGIAKEKSKDLPF